MSIVSMAFRISKDKSEARSSSLKQGKHWTKNIQSPPGVFVSTNSIFKVNQWNYISCKTDFNCFSKTNLKAMLS